MAAEIEHGWQLRRRNSRQREQTVSPTYDGQVVPGLVSAEISRKMVRLYRERLGRGPTKSRTTANVNTVMVAFEDTLTPRNRRCCVRARISTSMTYARQALADTMREDAIREIEELVGRKVKAYVSGLDPGANVAVLVFLLEPVKETGELGVTETDLDGRVRKPDLSG